MNSHKVKCDILKKVRKSIADKVGVDLHQKECTFEGECRGTCPKCKQEEDILNREILKRAGGLAIGATAALALTGCGPVTQSDLGEIQGGMTYGEDLGEINELEQSGLGLSEEEKQAVIEDMKPSDSTVVNLEESSEDEIESTTVLDGDIAFEGSESMEDDFDYDEVPIVTEGVLPYDSKYDE